MFVRFRKRPWGLIQPTDLILTELTDRERKKGTPMGNGNSRKNAGIFGKSQATAVLMFCSESETDLRSVVMRE